MKQRKQPSPSQRRKALDKLSDEIAAAGLDEASSYYIGMKPKLLPPAGFGSWLGYAVQTLDTRALELQMGLGDQRQWPKDTSTTDMRKAARDELVEFEQHNRCVATKGPGLSAVVRYLTDETLYEGYFVGVDGMYWRAATLVELETILAEQAKGLEHRPDRVVVAVLHF